MEIKENMELLLLKVKIKHLNNFKLKYRQENLLFSRFCHCIYY